MIQKKYPEDDRLSKLQVHQLFNRFQQIGQLLKANTTTVAILKRLDVVKAQNGCHIEHLM